MYSYNFKSTRGKDKAECKRPFKAVREHTVGYSAGRKTNDIPSIKLEGKWLKDIGFNIGDKCTVRCEQGKLIIEKSSEDEQSSCVVN